jgi:hypothetical protein
MKRSLANSGHMAQMARGSTGAPAVAEGVSYAKFVLFVALLTFSLFHCLPPLRPAVAATSRARIDLPDGFAQEGIESGKGTFRLTRSPEL